MLVEQAMFTSARGSRTQGYHLVAASPGVTDSHRRLLATWGPSHAALLDSGPDGESLNFHPLGEAWYALSRTITGGPEYSGRGGLALFTHYLLLREEHFALYQNHALWVAFLARARGLLRLCVDPPPMLNPIELPDEPLAARPELSEHCIVPIHDVLRVIQFGQPVAVIGLQDPLPTLDRILRTVPFDQRLGISFSTGLVPSVQRPLRLQFFAHTNPAIQRYLTQEQIDYVAAVDLQATSS